MSGRIRTREPEEILSASAGGPTGFYSFDVSLSAPVEPAAQPIATLAGEAARASAPARAFRQLLDAVIAGDVADAKAGTASNHRGRSMLTAEALPQVQAILLAGHPDAATLLADLRKVDLYDARAELYFNDAGGGMPMVQEGGAWKMGE